MSLASGSDIRILPQCWRVSKCALSSLTKKLLKKHKFYSTLKVFPITGDKDSVVHMFERSTFKQYLSSPSGPALINWKQVQVKNICWITLWLLSGSANYSEHGSSPRLCLACMHTPADNYLYTCCIYKIYLYCRLILR